jgi:hypothetical protein
MTRTRTLVAAVTGGLALAMMSAPAFADHYWRHRPYRHYYPPRVVYVPPPVTYVAPAPAYYYPPPVYYRPAPRPTFGIYFRG